MVNICIFDAFIGLTEHYTMILDPHFQLVLRY